MFDCSEPAGFEHGDDALNELLVCATLVVCLKRCIAAVSLGGDVDRPVGVPLSNPVHAVPARLKKVVVHHMPVLHQLADPRPLRR
eukprot:CAMPEP_0169448868 /NCGR_PEP_ID=MMETSP1042-20121227/12297_1 /TAXON_ID=464988 /ORGANISM="Hemiselmis andersenii, Strain CCMP1180" /LENGTH=84 /DNA_ID=CAMNT_0009560549 /DNA_START=283 /DNA_END=534 /DNA_ORIENTATION=+